MTKWDTIQADVADQYAYLDEEEVIEDEEDDIFGFSKAIELDHLTDDQLEDIATMLGIK
jgi:predicted DNA binding protein